LISVRDLKKTFRTADRKGSTAGDVTALRNVSFDIKDGEFFVLLGASGSGKTTLLRCLAGLESPTGGEIHIGNRLVYSKAQNIDVAPGERGLGMVFQSYAIWPHLTVFGNVALPLIEGRRKFSKDVVKEKVQRALALVGLQGLDDRPAPLLSGGQQQRVALARAMAVEPVVLLMDEPLSNLDARLREEVRGEIKALTARLGMTVVYVTHDQAEAMELADRVAVMAEGSILQVGSPEQVYSKPVHPQVAQFFGTVNWLEGIVSKPGAVHTPLGHLTCDDMSGFADQDKVAVGVRPENLEIFRSRGDGLENVIPCTITTTTFLGIYRVFTVRVGEASLLVMRTGAEKFDGPGYVHVPKSAIRLFSRDVLGVVKDLPSAPPVLQAG
jgi:iron(III) transport system ATP-binding protein